MKPVRPIHVEGDVAYVPLTKGYTAIIDAEDVPLVEGINWHANIRGKTVYAKRNTTIDGKRVTIMLHRLLLSPEDGLVVDHIDHNGLNNRRKNLRVCTPSQNSCNKILVSNNKSGYRGVTWNKDKNKWVANITVQGKQIYLGPFIDIEDAHKAYCEASEELHKEFRFTG